MAKKEATKQTGMSPYVKYKKTPYRYSDELMNWTAAIKKGDKASADRHDRAWKNKFGIRAPTPNYDASFDFLPKVDEEFYANIR